MKLRNFFKTSLLLLIAIFLLGIAVKESDFGAKSDNDIPRILENGETCSSYIYINYGEETIYPNGFIYRKKNNAIVDSRKSISDIYVDDKKYGLREPLTIPANSCLKLCFTETVTNFENFFDSNNDKNVNNIKSIDLSHFDSSSITSVKHMFKNC